MLYKKQIDNNNIDDFFVSPGDDFFVVFVSSTQHSHFILVVQPDSEMSSSNYQLHSEISKKQELCHFTKQFYHTKKSLFGKYSSFSDHQKEENNDTLFKTIVPFNTSEKRIKSIFFDQKFRGVFYLQFQDQSLEGHVISRNFCNQVQIEKINEIDLNSHQKESVTLKIEKNLNIIKIKEGNIFLYDSKGDDHFNLTSLISESDDLNRIIYKSFNNSDIIFSVPGPGFDCLSPEKSNVNVEKYFIIF